jgi:hypothetical protein
MIKTMKNLKIILFTTRFIIMNNVMMQPRETISITDKYLVLQENIILTIYRNVFYDSH